MGTLTLQALVVKRDSGDNLDLEGGHSHAEHGRECEFLPPLSLPLRIVVISRNSNSDPRKFCSFDLLGGRGSCWLEK